MTKVSTNDESVRQKLWFSAVARGHMKAMQRHLVEGVDINAHDSDGLTALHWAIEGRNHSLIGWLLEKGADPNERFRRRHHTPLHRLIESGIAAPWVQPFIDAGADVNAVDKHGNTPLHDAAFYGCTTVIQALVAAGADVNARNKDLNTPLHQVVQSRRFKDMAAYGSPINEIIPEVSMLLALGADMNTVNHFGENPLEWAIRYGCFDVATVLLKSGGAHHRNVGHGDGTILHEIMRFKVKKSSTVQIQHRIACVEHLVAGGEDVNACDNLGQSVLHKDAYGEVVAVLVGAGAHPNLKDNEGRTPLDYHVSKANVEAIKALIVAGATTKEENLTLLMQDEECRALLIDRERKQLTQQAQESLLPDAEGCNKPSGAKVSATMRL